MRWQIERGPDGMPTRLLGAPAPQHRETTGSLQVGPFIAKDRDVVLMLTIPGDPLSKQRPRWARKTGHMFTPEATRHHEEGIKLLAKAAYRELAPDTMALFSLRAAFYLKTNQRRDVDNMLKLVSDALTGLVWADDSQVVEVFAFKVPADQPAEARAEIVVARMPGMMPYQFGACALCTRPFRTYPSWRYRGFCGRRCYGLANRRRITIPCTRCAQPVERTTGAPKTRETFCSMACRRAYQVVTLTCVGCAQPFTLERSMATRRKTCSAACAATRARAAKRGRPQGTCVQCGRGVTRKEYQRCKACQMQNVADKTITPRTTP